MGSYRVGSAITVRYVGPTNHRGSRWVATADHPIGRQVVPYDYAADSGIDNAYAAASALLDRWRADWTERHPDIAYPYAIIAGGHTGGDAYAFVVAIPETPALPSYDVRSPSYRPYGPEAR